MKTATVTSVLGVSFLVLFVTPAAPHRQRRAATAPSDGWQPIFEGPLKPRFARLADLAVRKFTTGVEYYHAVNKVMKVEKKQGNQFRLTFLYVPTDCPVTDVFEPDRCFARGAKPTGQCEAVVIVKKRGPFVDWINCDDFDTKGVVQRAPRQFGQGGL